VGAHGRLGQAQPHREIGDRRAQGELGGIPSQHLLVDEDFWMRLRLGQGRVDRAEHPSRRTPLHALGDLSLNHAELNTRVRVRRVEQEGLHESS
jgi:hypothetical protein